MLLFGMDELEGGDKRLLQAMLIYPASAYKVNHGTSSHVQVPAHGLLADRHDLGHLVCRQAMVRLDLKNHLIAELLRRSQIPR